VLFPKLAETCMTIAYTIGTITQHVG